MNKNIKLRKTITIKMSIKLNLRANQLRRNKKWTSKEENQAQTCK